MNSVQVRLGQPCLGLMAQDVCFETRRARFLECFDSKLAQKIQLHQNLFFAWIASEVTHRSAWTMRVHTRRPWAD